MLSTPTILWLTDRMNPSIAITPCSSLLRYSHIFGTNDIVRSYVAFGAKNVYPYFGILKYKLYILDLTRSAHVEKHFHLLPFLVKSKDLENAFKLRINIFMIKNISSSTIRCLSEYLLHLCQI